MALNSGELPPLNALVVFEAAARLGNFSRTGAELGLTQSAVSRQILKLEAFIGAKLFTRTASGVALTPRGETYALEVHRLLADLAGVTSSLRGWNGPRQVTVACSHATADLWLAPRLPALQAALPMLELRLRVTNDFVHLRFDEYDLALFYHRRPPSGLHLTLLGEEEVFPVMRPGDAPLLARATPTLLALEDPLREWNGWTHWLDPAGIALPPGALTWQLGTYALTIEAALRGLGVALGWEWLIRDHLADGRLVTAHPHRQKLDGGFYLSRPADRHARRIVREVADWVIANNR